MGRTALTRTNLLLETGKVRRLRKALQSRSNSEAVRRRNRRAPGGGGWTSGPAGSAKAGRSGGRLRARSSKEEMTALPAEPLLFDTGIYIRFSRGGNSLWLGEDARVFQRTILTAVVAA